MENNEKNTIGDEVSNAETRKKLMKYIKKYMFFIVLSLILAVIRVVSTLYLPIQTAQVIDHMLGAGRVDFPGISRILVQMAAVICVTVVSTWLMTVVNNHITFNVVRNIRNDCIKKIEVLPLSVIDSNDSGELVSRVIADVEQTGDGLLLGFTQAFTGVFTILMTLVFMVRLNWMITAAVVILTPVSFFVASFIARHSYNMFQKQSETRGEQTAFINEMIPNQQVVAAYSYEDRAVKKFDDINDRLAGYSMKATFYSSITNPSTRFVNSLVYAAVGIMGSIFALHGVITVGTLSGFLTYANQYTKPFNDISGVITELQNAFACAGRVFKLLDAPEEEDAGVMKDYWQRESGNADSDKNSGGKASDIYPGPEGFTGMIDAENVVFSYIKGQEILKGVDFHINPGERIAVVGPTGCGKTTLINLIMRFYEPDSGKFLADGRDLKNIPKYALRKQIGMVLQDTWIATGTVAENIAFGNPGATREEIVKAAREAYADSFIRRLPEGYDTVINETGGNLSQGQKQLICIARVMLISPAFLILDEATSNIDTLTEVKVNRAFDKLMSGSTSLTVAHRLSTIKNADRILVFNDGKIAESGTHRELMKKNGYYAAIYNSQFA